MADEIDIATAAASPKKITGDEGSVEMPTLPELIEADKYLRQRTASKSTLGGMKLVKLVSPGAI